MGTSYLPGTVLGAEDEIMNKAGDRPAFTEINSDEGWEVDRVGSQKRLEEGTEIY